MTTKCFGTIISKDGLNNATTQTQALLKSNVAVNTVKVKTKDEGILVDSITEYIGISDSHAGFLIALFVCM